MGQLFFALLGLNLLQTAGLLWFFNWRLVPIRRRLGHLLGRMDQYFRKPETPRGD